MVQNNNSNTELELILSDSNLAELTQDYGEIFIDSMLDDGLLKDIPLVGSLVKLVNFGNSINRHFFAKKIYKFLFELKSISPEKRKKKIKEINDSKEYQSKVGEIILELLDKSESDYKPEILGKLLKAFIEDIIDFKTYLRLAHIVQTVFIYDLLELKKSVFNESYCTYRTDQFVIMGLVNLDFVTPFKNELNGIKQSEYIELSELGIILTKYGMA